MSPGITDERPHAAGRAPPAPLWATLLWAALLVALAAVAGSIWLSVGMGLKACPLCFYQRSFVMGVAAVLGIGLLTGRRHRGALGPLALPMAAAGLGVAAFHVYLELSGRLECPPGVLGIGSAPQQSLAALTLLFILLLAAVARGGRAGEPHGPASITAIVLGLLLAWGAVASAPPLPPPPSKAHEQPLDTCRPPFQP